MTSFSDVAAYTDMIHLCRRESKKGVTRETFLEDIENLKAGKATKEIMIRAVNDFYNRNVTYVPVMTGTMIKERWN